MPAYLPALLRPVPQPYTVDNEHWGDSGNPYAVVRMCEISVVKL